MNRRPLTTIVTRLFRGAFFITLLFTVIGLMRFAQGQQPSTRKSQTNSDAPLKLNTANSTKTFVRVHDGAERSEVALAQPSYRATTLASPSGTICGLESRAAHGQPA